MEAATAPATEAEALNPPAPAPAAAAPTEAEAHAAELARRGLFRYRDGYRDRLADVVVVQLRMQGALPRGDMGRLDELLEAIAGPRPAVAVAADAGAVPAPAPDAAPAEGRPSVPAALVELAGVVGVAFDLPELDLETGEGLTVQERVDLLGDFLASMPAAGEGDEDDDADDA